MMVFVVNGFAIFQKNNKTKICWRFYKYQELENPWMSYNLPSGNKRRGVLINIS